MGTFIAIILAAVLTNNFITVKTYGICPFLGVSKKTSSALGMGVAVTIVMTIAVAVTYPVYEYVMVPLGIDYLEIIVFIFIIASLVHLPSLNHHQLRGFRRVRAGYRRYVGDYRRSFYEYGLGSAVRAVCGARLHPRYGNNERTSRKAQLR